jgi:hypothetical protein
VGIVQEGYVFVFVQPLGLVVAGVAAVLRCFSFTLDDILVALLAGNMAGPYEIQMVESKPLKLDILSGDFMASCAIAQGERTLLPAGGLEMAEVAGTIRYLNVCAHHNLAVAACAAKLLSSAQVPQVKFVVEADPFFVSHLSRQDVRGVTARPEAGGLELYFLVINWTTWLMDWNLAHIAASV